MLNLYYPGAEWVTISVTGKECDLRCAHCGAKFLGHMIPATTPKALYDIAMEQDDKGAIGMLVSGGCDSRGAVPIFDYLDIIKNIKNHTNLIINAHIGFPAIEEIPRLAESDIDIVSFDVVGSKTAMKRVYGLDLAVEYFDDALDAFREAGINVVPHVTAGLDSGNDSGEEGALRIIARHGPKVVIVNALMGVSDKESRLIKVLGVASETLPEETGLSLGCMRPRDIELDALAVLDLGVTAVAMPSKRFISQLNDLNIEFAIKNGCCALESL